MPPDRFFAHFGFLWDVILCPMGGRGALGRPFGPLGVPCRPPVTPRSIFLTFCLSFWEHCWNQNRGKKTYCFFCSGPAYGGILNDFGTVWEDFFDAITTPATERGIFQKCLFYIRNSTVFKGCGFHCGYQKWEKVAQEFDPDFNSFFIEFWSICGIPFGPKIIHKSVLIFFFFSGR